MKKIIGLLCMALLLTACSSTQKPTQPTSPSTTVPETTAPTVQTEPVPEISVIERFLNLCPDTFADLAPMDIQGDDYRTEFRLQAFKNAEGIKGTFPGGTVAIVNYGVWDNDSIRFYLTAETYEDGVAIYQTIISALNSSLTAEEISAELDSLDHVSSASIYLAGGRISGSFNAHYANGGISGYEIMIDCTEILF